MDFLNCIMWGRNWPNDCSHLHNVFLIPVSVIKCNQLKTFTPKLKLFNFSNHIYSYMLSFCLKMNKQSYLKLTISWLFVLVFFVHLHERLMHFTKRAYFLAFRQGMHTSHLSRPLSAVCPSRVSLDWLFPTDVLSPILFFLV